MDTCVACEQRPATHTLDGDKLCDPCITAIIEGSADIPQQVGNGADAFERNYDVHFSALRFVHAIARVSAGSPELAKEKAIAEASTLNWSNSDIDDDTIEANEVVLSECQPEHAR